MANIKIADTKATIQFDCLGTPTHYRVSESNDFTGAVWTSFVNQDLTIDYPLNEFKAYNLFLQVKSSVMESNIKTVTFDRIDDYVAVNLKVVILNNGISETNINNIPITLQYDGVPKFFKYSLNPELLEGEVQWDIVEWIDFNSFPSTFYIGGSDGNKKLYFLLKDSRDATSELNNNIMYYSPVAPTLTGADFLENTINNIVTITPTYSGIVTQYSCEKTGQPLIWYTFESPSFNITLDTDGLNNYSIVLKNTYGQSTSYNISITYTPLTFDIDEVIINNGDAETTTTTLSVNVTKIGTDDIAYYRIGVNPDLSSLEWLPYTSFPVNYNIAKHTQSAGVGIYAQIKGTTGLESQVKFDTIYYVYTDSVTVKVIGKGANGSQDYMTFEGKTYNYSRIIAANKFDVYEYNSAEKLLDWKIMNDAETISEFGGAGENPGGIISSAFPEGHPYRECHRWFGNETKPWVYYGLYVPNGTYKVSFLVSYDDSSLMNAYSRSLSVNGVNITLPAIPISGNTQFVDLGNHYVSDGKLKFILGVRDNKSFGFNGITIEKIA